MRLPMMLSYPLRYARWCRLVIILMMLTAGTAWAVDSDRDLLENDAEISWGTNPDNPDSDADGFLDGEEVEQGTNPTNPDSYPQLNAQGRSRTIFCPAFSVLNNGAPATQSTQNAIFCPSVSIQNNGAPAIQSTQNAIFCPSVSILNNAAPATQATQNAIFCPSVSILNNAPPATQSTQSSIFCPSVSVLNNAPPAVTAYQKTLSTPQFSIYNGICNLNVAVEPAAAAAAGAQWRRAGTSTWLNAGFTETNVPPGSYTIEFKSIPGWIAPASQAVTITAGETTNASAIYVAMNPPTTPINQSPAAGAVGVALAPTLQASAFSDPDPGDTHAATQWQVRAASSGADHSVTVFDSGTDAVNLTSNAIPSGLLVHNTEYAWRVRYQDSQGVWTDWSSETRFTTTPWYGDYDFSAKGVLAYWPLDGNTQDYGPNDLDGTAYHSSPAEGKIGQGYDFGGGLDGAASRIEVPTYPNCEALSIGAWVYLNSYATGAYHDQVRTIFNRRAHYSDQYLTVMADGRVNFYNLRGTNVPVNEVYSTRKISLGKWHYVLGTMDANWTRIYIDGVLAGENASMGSIDWSGAYHSTHIGVNGDSAGNYWNPWNGRLDEVVVFGRVLSAEEVGDLARDDDGNGQSDFWETPTPTITWTQLQTATPPARTDHAMAYDSDRGVTLLYGGADTQGKNDTWEFDGTIWTQRTPPHNPGVISQHALANDPARHRMVYYGNTATKTWEYYGADWHAVTTAHAPAAVMGMDMVYYPKLGGMVLFGGETASGVDKNETWLFDGSDWRQLSPTSSPSTILNGRGMAYDANRNVLVMYGGYTNGGAGATETWEFDGLNWRQVTTAATAPGGGADCLAWSGAARRTVYATGGTHSARNNQNWLYDGLNWVQITPSPRPPARYETQMVYDAAHRQLVLYGGFNGSHLNDTWLGTTAQPRQTRPNRPANLVPAHGATGVPLAPTLQASPFDDPNPGDTHAASQWQVRAATSATDYSVTVYDSGADTAHLITIPIPAGRLSYDTQYAWRVRYQDNNGAWSNWSAETGFTVRPLTDPTITGHPIALTVNHGASAIFHVTASGTAPLHYAWRKNGSTISGAADSDTFTIASATAADEALYSCRVSNANGYALSNAAQLTVRSVHNETSNQWYQTIQAAVTAAASGQVIMAYPRFYSEAVTVNKSLTLKGQQGTPATVLQGGIRLTDGSIDLRGFQVWGGRDFAGGILTALRIDSTASQMISGCVLDGVFTMPGQTSVGVLMNAGARDVTLVNSELRNWNTGVRAGAMRGLILDGDWMDTNGVGLETGALTRSWVARCIFQSNGVGWQALAGGAGVGAGLNRFEGNLTGAVGAASPCEPVDLRGSWWGDASGPAGGLIDPVSHQAAGGSGDEVGAYVRFDPRLTRPDPSLTASVNPTAIQGGQTLHFDWSSQGLSGGSAIVYGTVDGGVTWLPLGTGTIPDGSLNWAVPGRFTSNIRLCVYWLDNLFVFGETSNVSITPAAGTQAGQFTLTMNSSVRKGQVLPISWTGQNVSGLADIYVSVDGGETWSWLATGQSGGGTLNWLVHLGPTAQARVRVFSRENQFLFGEKMVNIMDATAPANEPRITASVSPGPVQPGQNLAIQWTGQAVSGIADAYVSTDNEHWNWIGTGPAGAGTVNWTVNLSPGQTAWLRVYSRSYTYIYGDAGSVAVRP